MDRPQSLHRLSTELCGERSSATLHLAREALDKVVHLAILLHELRDLVDGMENRSVVAVADTLADLGKAGISQLTREIHDEVAALNDAARPLVADDLGDRHARGFGDGGKDSVDGNAGGGRFGDVLDTSRQARHRAGAS